MAARPMIYLSRTELAERIGVKPAILSRYKLPEPTVIVGATGYGTMGWLPETFDVWIAAWPGPGNWASRTR